MLEQREMFCVMCWADGIRIHRIRRGQIGESWREGRDGLACCARCDSNVLVTGAGCTVLATAILSFLLLSPPPPSLLPPRPPVWPRNWSTHIPRSPPDIPAMKAFLNRLNRGLSKEKDKDKDVAYREKIPSLPPLTEWPPSQQRASSTPPSVASTFKPLPDLSTRPLPPIDEPSSESPGSSSTPTPTKAATPLPSPKPDPAPQIAPSRSGQSRSDQDSAGRSSRKTANGSSGSGSADVHKKVAFISPPPTPGPQSDRQLPSIDSPPPTNGGPVKSTVSRFQATQGKESRGSTSTAASSKTDVTSTLKSAKPGSTRAATSPLPKHFNDGASMHQSLRSTTPYSQMTNASSRILAAQSWSEVAEEDLVSNLGQRERTRQEVLWEIVASEER